MSRDLFFFDDSKKRVEAALTSLRSGGGVIVVDDDSRENEGDLIFPAQSLTEAQMAMLIRYCSGIVCLCLTPEKATVLELPPVAAHNSSQYGTAFTVSIEAARGVTTGVSAHDRVHTVKTAVSETAKPADLNRPGHVFPLVARAGGVLERQGHTEATVDLMSLADLLPAGILCELTNDDGSMSRLPEISEFASEHDLPLLTVADIVAYRLQLEKTVC